MGATSDDTETLAEINFYLCGKFKLWRVKQKGIFIFSSDGLKIEIPWL